MSHKLHCTLNNQFSALENWTESKGYAPRTKSEEYEVITWAMEYSTWNCNCDQEYKVGTRY